LGTTIPASELESPVYYKDCHPGEGQDLLIYKRDCLAKTLRRKEIRFYITNRFGRSFCVADQVRHDSEFLWAPRFQPPSWNLLYITTDCHPGVGQDLLIYKRDCLSKTQRRKGFRFYKTIRFGRSFFCVSASLREFFGVAWRIKSAMTEYLFGHYDSSIRALSLRAQRANLLFITKIVILAKARTSSFDKPLPVEFITAALRIVK
jgi:hypothetical protein